MAHRTTDPALGADLVAHLETQIESAGRLLGSILKQGAAIRRREVDSVLAHVADTRAEMDQRGLLEQQRAALLRRAGAILGMSPGAVTLEAVAAVLPIDLADRARTVSAELRGLLAEIAREHSINRALMRQELAFLEHLVRLIGHEPGPAYGPGNTLTSATRRVVDLEA